MTKSLQIFLAASLIYFPAMPNHGYIDDPFLVVDFIYDAGIPDP